MISSLVEPILQKCRKAEFYRTKDQISFVFNTLRLGLAAYLLGRWPCFYPTFNILSALIFLPIRIAHYSYIRWHYTLIDFCYYANYMVIIHQYFYPESIFLHNVSFAFSFGPILMAVLMLQNAVVPHSFDKIISNYTHIGPALSLIAVRINTCQDYPILPAFPFWEYMAYSTGCYLLWAVPFYFITFVLAYESNIKNNNVTLYGFLMATRKNTLSHSFCGMLGERFRPLMFMLEHFLFAIGTFPLTYIFISNVYLCISSLVLALSYGIWNGATFYMSYMPKKYEKNLQAIEDYGSKFK